MAHLDDAGRFGRAVGLARRRWLELPGVVGVGYGLRETDGRFLDERERGPEPPAFYRYGRVGEAVVEAPYAGLPGQDVLDGVAAYHAFRLAGYPDLYDFVTYFVDPGSGLPRGSSYHLGVSYVNPPAMGEAQQRL